MSVTVKEDRLSFDFPDGWDVSKYDDWDYYQKQFLSIADGTKAVDIVALPIEKQRTLWLIEIKDFRNRTHPSAKVGELAEDMGKKVRDTLAGLAAARLRTDDISQELFALRASNSHDLRVVLHVEQPATGSKLFPTPIDRAKLQQKLRNRLKAVDCKASVVDQNNLTIDMKWIVKG